MVVVGDVTVEGSELRKVWGRMQLTEMLYMNEQCNECCDIEARLDALLVEVGRIEGIALLGSKSWYGYMVNARENIKIALDIERKNNGL